MKNTVIINTQYKENYGAHDWDGNGECPQHWKMKGGFQFQLEMNTDFLLYEESACIEVFKKMLTNESNDHEAFEYIDHEIQWSEPTKLNSEEFMAMLQKQVA